MNRRNLCIDVAGIGAILWLLSGCAPSSKTTTYDYGDLRASYRNDRDSTPVIIRIEIKPIASIQYVMIFDDGAQLPLTGLTKTSLEGWAKERNIRMELKESINLAELPEYGDGHAFYFTQSGDLKTISVKTGDAKIKITKGNQEVTWPCSQDRLAGVIGMHTSKKEYDNRVPFGVR